MGERPNNLVNSGLPGMGRVRFFLRGIIAAFVALHNLEFHLIA